MPSAPRGSRKQPVICFAPRGEINDYELQNGISFSPDGNTIAFSSGSRIIVWDVYKGNQLGELVAEDCPLDKVSFSPDERWIVSTKACSHCGEIGAPLLLSQRVFCCEACGLEIDRDWNAALNLWHYGLAALNGPTGSSLGSNACGEGKLQGICPVPLVEAGSNRSFVSPQGAK